MVFKFNPLFALLTFRIIYQGRNQYEGNWTWHKVWNLLTVNLTDKSIHSSIDWSVVYHQVCMSPWLRKLFQISIVQITRKSIFVKLLPLSLAWSDHKSPPYRATLFLHLRKYICPPPHPTPPTPWKAFLKKGAPYKGHYAAASIINKAKET